MDLKSRLAGGDRLLGVLLRMPSEYLSRCARLPDSTSC